MLFLNSSLIEKLALHTESKYCFKNRGLSLVGAKAIGSNDVFCTSHKVLVEKKLAYLGYFLQAAFEEPPDIE